MFRTLRSRLILNALLPLLIILPVVGIVLANLLQTQLVLGNITTELTRQGVLVADYAASRSDIFSDPESAHDFVARISPNVPAKVMLLDAQGRLIVSSDPGDTVLVGTLYSVPDVNRLIASNSPAEITYNGQGIQAVVVPVYTPAQQFLGYIRLANPLAELYNRTSTLKQATLFVVGGGLLLGILISLLLARDLERPLRRTTEAAYQLAAGVSFDPLQEKGPKEIRVLVEAFNTLVTRLHTLEESRKRLLANLVHELGTPIGALRSAVLALQGGAYKQADLRDDLLAGMNDELILLKHLTEELASMHDQVLGPLDLHLEPIQPSVWLSQLLAPWTEAAHEKHLQLDSEIPDGLPAIQADQDRLAQSISNLVSNAIRYTPTGGKISVKAGREENQLVVAVSDDGPGIDVEDLERIFEPFKRGKTARRFADGMGLGLSIARDMIRAHGGELSVESSPGEGSTFFVRLPFLEKEALDYIDPEALPAN